MRGWRANTQYAREHGRGWAVAALALGVLLALLAVMALSISSYGQGMQSGSQAGFYYTGLLLSGYLAAHRLHGVWRSREAALVYLMRPAAVFEKWLLAALLALLVWPLIYSAVGEVLIPGVQNAGDIEKTDGCRQAAALAEKI